MLQGLAGWPVRTQTSVPAGERRNHVFQPRRIAQRQHVALACGVERIAAPVAHRAARAFDHRHQRRVVVELQPRLADDVELPGRQDAEPSVHVVVNVDGAAVSMLVDSIGDVVDAGSSSFERPPDTLDEWVRELILGVHKLEGRLLLVLDVVKATDVAPALAA